ncbi:MAG: hypothetical protein JXA28_06160 [Bacteroidetes bacterium]|nr:hypothetical protein [Bacteroidota bacterium]
MPMLGRLMLIYLLGFPIGLAAQAPADAEAMSMLLRDAAAEAASRVTQESVLLRVLPDDGPVLVTQVFAEELQERSHRVVIGDAEAGSILTVEIREMYSSTASSGKSSYFRMMHATLGILLEDRTRNAVTWSREMQLSRTDTLDGVAPYTQRFWLAERPSFWSRLLEPLLVTVSVFVIALLLFTVRGS